MSYNQYKKMTDYFSKPYKPFGGNISLKLDLYTYAKKKTDL